MQWYLYMVINECKPNRLSSTIDGNRKFDQLRTTSQVSNLKRKTTCSLIWCTLSILNLVTWLESQEDWSEIQIKYIFVLLAQVNSFVASLKLDKFSTFFYDLKIERLTNEHQGAETLCMCVCPKRVCVSNTEPKVSTVGIYST